MRDKTQQEKAESFDILMKRGETKIFEENKQLKEIVEKLKNHLAVMKQWKPRDETTAHHIKWIEEILETKE